MTRPRRPNVGEFFATFHGEHEKAGQPVTRQKWCACGERFTQHLLSEEFLSACEAIRGGNPLARVREQIPDFFVPVHCPRCERVDLGRQAAIDRARSGDPFDWKEAAA